MGIKEPRSPFFLFLTTCSIKFKEEICFAIPLWILKCHRAEDELRLWYSALMPPSLLPPSWVFLSQINLSWLLYWQARRRIWQGKPVTYKPRVEPPFLPVFRSSLTGTAVDGEIYLEIWDKRKARSTTDDAQNRGRNKGTEEVKTKTNIQASPDAGICFRSRSVWAETVTGSVPVLV